MSENRVIGRQGGLPWRLRSDLARFRQLTMGHSLIMGRKTFESLGKSLPGRRMIVVSRSAAPRAGIEIAASLEDALALAHNDSEPFIAGGGEIYRQALPWADRIYLTRVHADLPGDTHFPEFSLARFALEREELHPQSNTDEFPHTFQVWRRSEWGENPAC